MTDPDRWGGLQVRYLRAFTTVVDQGSFSAAAHILGYSQSGISQQILALERIIGARLLTRHPGGRRPLELTPAGTLMLRHARAVLARIGTTAADLSSLAAGEITTLAVCTVPSFGARVLPRILGRFRDQQPGVHVSIAQTLRLAEVSQAVEASAADVGFAARPVADGPFEIRPLISDCYVLVTREDRAERRLEDLDGIRVLAIRGTPSDQLIEQQLVARRIVPLAIERFDDNAMIQALVLAGEGVALVPRLTIDPATPALAAHPISDFPPRDLVAITHRERVHAPALETLVDVAVDVCTGLTEPS